MKKPLIGILLTTYNDGEMINNCIKSIYSQNYENLIIVCVDDGSEKDVQEFLDFDFNENRLIIKKIPHSERAVARDTGISILNEQKVEYFMFMDSDMSLPQNFIRNLVEFTLSNKYVGVVIPEMAYSSYTNYWSKVKVFERNLYKVDSKVNSSSIEAARFWKLEKFPGFEEGLKAFEEIQPTLKALKSGLSVGRINNIHMMHDEKFVTLNNLLNKKRGYFNNMSSHKSVNFKSVITKFYFFRPQLYKAKNLLNYIKNPHLFFGVILMYLILSFYALTNFVKGRTKINKNEGII